MSSPLYSNSIVQTRNQAAKQRSKNLALLAKDKLEAEKLINEGLIINIKVFQQATKDVDPEGNGISIMTITRNPDVHKIFQSLSNECQKRQKKVKKKKRTATSGRVTQEEYKGIKRNELIQKIAVILEKNYELDQRILKLINERDQLLKQCNNQILYIAKVQEGAAVRSPEKSQGNTTYNNTDDNYYI